MAVDTLTDSPREEGLFCAPPSGARLAAQRAGPQQLSTRSSAILRVIHSRSDLCIPQFSAAGGRFPAAIHRGAHLLRLRRGTSIPI